MSEQAPKKAHRRGMGFAYQRGAVWWIAYYVRGKRHREPTEAKNESQANSLLKQRHLDARSGKPFGLDVEKTTLADLVSMIENDYKSNGLKERVIRAPLAHLEEYFGEEARAIDITSDRITAYVANRQTAGAANATINRSLSALKRAFKLAEIAGKAANRPHIAMLREDNRRKGFFEREDYQALLEHLPDYLKPVAAAAYITGWRITSELLTRKQHHADLANGWLRLEPGESKNREGRMFPLTPELRKVLHAQLEATRELEREIGRIIPWLFHHDGEPIRVFRRAWISACNNAEIGNRLPHDFRRTAVRNLERAGVPRSAAMAMVGHRTMAIYSRYAIADETMLKAGAEKLAALNELESARPAAPKVVAIGKGA
ncbi:MAG: tyrosine-type recombinase/integrase [Candidatus Binataceae bacterium]